MRKLLFCLGPALMLSGCGSSDSADGPGGITAGEARALNDAAAMLDARADNVQNAQADNSAAATGF